MKTRWLVLGLTLPLSALELTGGRAVAAPPAASAAIPSPLFKSVAPEASGLTFVHHLETDALQAYLYNSPYACGGVVLGDVDGNGSCDVFLIGGVEDNALFLNRGGLKFEKSPASATLADPGAWGVGGAMADVDGDRDLDIYVCNYDGVNRLWLNNGQGQFTEAGAKAGLDVSGPSHSPYFADLDNDGDLDLLVVTNRLHSPTGRPRESASEVGPDGSPRVKDKYASYFRVITLPDGVTEDGSGTTPGSPSPAGLSRQFLLEYGHPDRLFRNDGPGPDGVPRFRDVTRGSGLEDADGHGLSALLWDVNGDGLTDIYVANDYADVDRFWLNLGPSPDGGFHFRDATDELVPYTTWSSMGSDLADINGDGRFDFLVADMAATTHFKAKTTMGAMEGYRRWVLENGWPRQAMRNMLFVATPAGRFLEAAFQAGVARTDWTWGVRFGDYDLDGRPDLFISNGVARSFSDSDVPVTPAMVTGHTEWEFYKDTPPMREQNLAFRNDGELHFSDVSKAWGLDVESMSYGAASGDLDADGDLDLVVCNLTENVSLFQNQAADRGGSHWLKVRLEGRHNRFGFGAVVTARLDNGTPLVGLMNPQTGYLSGNEPIIHFGLGTAWRVTSLEIRWPAGTVQHLGPQKADRVIELREPEIEPRAAQKKPASGGGVVKTLEGPAGGGSSKGPEKRARFSEIADRVGLKFRHFDRPFDDYQREFLLPGKLSQFGPGVAVSDVNGDGLDDIFVGGAAGQPASLFVHQPDHSFQSMPDPPWTAHAASEDMGALFFDADRDGDLDLYVASGSNESNPGDPLYADHLYLNQSALGKPPVFAEAASGVLPDIRQSGSCVVGADFDRDGDVDLFIGARSVPGQYLVVPESTLLRNDGPAVGQAAFADVTDPHAPGLKHAGLVTSALWSDVDRDGWVDLLVACEWGAVRLFHNQHGRLHDVTAAAGLGARSGWWNAITGGDFDADGDIDYLVCNAGLNTKYGHPTETKPLFLYRGDMDNNGVFDLVEAKKSTEGELLPVRGRSCSSTAMPFLKEKFSTYRAFASATLEGIYSTEHLSRSIQTSANELASGCLMNRSEPGHPRFVWQALPSLTQLSPGFGAVAQDFSGTGAPVVAVAQNLYSREPETGLWRGGLGVMLHLADRDHWVEEDAGASGFIIPGDGKGLATLELNGDGWPDLVATQNNGRLLAFQHQGTAAAPLVTVRLIGSAGNPTCLGARVSVSDRSSLLSSAEVYGGSGYLSQSSPVIRLARPKGRTTAVLDVHWPSGLRSEAALKDVGATLILNEPTP